MGYHTNTKAILFGFALVNLLVFTDSVVALSYQTDEICTSRHGARCRIITASTPSSTPLTKPTRSQSNPLVLIGGMAQSLSSWDHHLPSLCRHRNKVIVYECLGQGPQYVVSGTSQGTSTSTDTEESSDVQGQLAVDNNSNLTLQRQGEVLWESLDEILLNEGINESYMIDVAGFSFGGRVALAAGVMRHGCICKCHLSGIAVDRTDRGYMAMKSFPDIIRSDPTLRSFAWSILLATYSSGFLRSLPSETLQRILTHICDNNTPAGLLALTQQCEICDKSDPWHVQNMIQRLDPSLKSNHRTTLCVGEYDEMAPVKSVLELNNLLVGTTTTSAEEDVHILPATGHAVTIESPGRWRASVLSLLNS